MIKGILNKLIFNIKWLLSGKKYTVISGRLKIKSIHSEKGYFDYWYDKKAWEKAFGKSTEL